MMVVTKGGRFKFAAVIVFVVGGCSAIPIANGGSLTPDPLLGVIRLVDLVVSSGDLGYEPIPGIDRRELEKHIGEHCQKMLRIAGIEVSDSAEAQFLVSINHSWKGARREDVALLVTLEMTVPGEPVEKNKSLPLRKRSLVIWSDSRLELGDASEARAIIMTALDAALKDLVDSRRAALPEAQGPDEL